MIRINLLPGTEKKARAGKAAAAAPPGGGAMHPIVLLALLAFGAVDGYLFWSAQAKVSGSRETVAAKKADLQKVYDQINELGPEAAQIDYEMKLFDTQLEVLESLKPRLLWSQKLNQLAKLIPTTVFLNELTLTENFREVETKSSIEARKAWEKKKLGPKPETQKKPVISYAIRMTGLSTGTDSVEQLDNVAKFHDALVGFEEKNEKGETVRFMDNMKPSIAFEFVEAYIYQRQYPVQRFAFRLESLAMGDQEATEGLAAKKGPKHK
jgi:hypothetical protein